MRYALIADIHANFPALESTLADLERRGLDRVYHLGDLVGYGPWPNEVIYLIRDREISGISGNFDSTLGAGEEPASGDPAGLRNFRWTAGQITGPNRAFLRSLPFRSDHRPFGGHATGPTVMLVHATPALNTVAWWPHLADDFHLEMARHAGARAGDVICFGHIHRPWYRELAGIHFVSVGSVGRPKDGDPRCCYAIVEIQAGSVRIDFVRVEYDVERAVAGILETDLPSEFADFLRSAGAT